MGSGLYATWINSDDMLVKNALANHVLGTGLDGEAVYVGDCINIDETGGILFTHRGRVHSFEDLVRIPSVWRSGGYISQPAVLFPLALALRVGGLNEDNHLTMDYELWGKFLLAGARFQYTGIPFGFFRWNHGQKTQNSLAQTESTLDAAIELIGLANSFSADLKLEILSDLQAYRDMYPNQAWKQSGRLARIGLPPVVVMPMRNLKDAFQKKIRTLIGPTRGYR